MVSSIDSNNINDGGEMDNVKNCIQALWKLSEILKKKPLKLIQALKEESSKICDAFWKWAQF